MIMLFSVHAHHQIIQPFLSKMWRWEDKQWQRACRACLGHEFMLMCVWSEISLMDAA